jgi:hypothetical protein
VTRTSVNSEPTALSTTLDGVIAFTFITGSPAPPFCKNIMVEKLSLVILALETQIKEVMRTMLLHKVNSTLQILPTPDSYKTIRDQNL